MTNSAWWSMAHGTPAGENRVPPSTALEQSGGAQLAVDGVAQIESVEAANGPEFGDRCVRFGCGRSTTHDAAQAI